MDPTGHHAFISLTNEKAYYLHASSTTPKLCSKIKVMLILSLNDLVLN
jgi:hypothetical protein